jgi:ERCC4-type nuclease
MLIIDVRENKLIELIKTKTQFPIYQTASLPVGDIIIRHSEGDITYEIILERKCVTDMIASIKDG